VNEVAAEPVPAPPAVQRWGLGDVAVGWLGVFLAASIWGVAILAATGHVDDDLDEVPLGVVALVQLGLAAGFFLVPWAVTRAKGNGIVADLGLRARWPDVWQGALAGVAAQLVLIPLLYWPILDLVDRTADDLGEYAEALTDRASSPVDVILLVLIVGVMAPVFEEIFYRGLMQRSLLKRGLPPALAIGTTALFFGATHLQLLQLPGLVVAGLVFGVLAHRSGRLGPAIAAHVAFNLVTVVNLLAA
jgi:membrane protease YdiL (CAAX protease family)